MACCGSEHIPTAAATIMVFLRPNFTADQPENKPPMAVPAVYVEATAPKVVNQRTRLVA
jgi:hypothetical protein